MIETQPISPLATLGIAGLVAAIADPRDVSELLDFRATSSLQELMAAERLVASQRQNFHRHGSGDVTAARLREKRRQKAKQLARRVKASRS